jgi:hypothetical protein
MPVVSVFGVLLMWEQLRCAMRQRVAEGLIAQRSWAPGKTFAAISFRCFTT